VALPLVEALVVPPVDPVAGMPPAPVVAPAVVVPLIVADVRVVPVPVVLGAPPVPLALELVTPEVVTPAVVELLPVDIEAAVAVASVDPMSSV